MVFWMIVTKVLVDVQRRHRGRRNDHGLHQHECDEPAHEDSLSEAAPSTVVQVLAAVMEKFRRSPVSR